jgi:hypothetical protein
LLRARDILKNYVGKIYQESEIDADRVDGRNVFYFRAECAQKFCLKTNKSFMKEIDDKNENGFVMKL